MIAKLEAEKTTTQPLTKRRRRKAETDGIKGFAERYRLKIRTDPGDDTRIIAGQLGHLYQADEGLLGVMVMPDSGGKRRWSCARAKLQEAGFVILQDGDTEGSACFSRDNPAQAKLAIKIVGAKKKRAVSQAQGEQLIKARETLRRRPKTGLKTPDTPPGDLRHGENVLEA
jgi:hypothetical protein